MTADALPVVLITGGGSGIGAATAEALAGSRRVAISGRSADKLSSVAERTGAQIFPADISNPDDAERLIRQVVEAFGRLDGLVLNAASSQRPAPLADITYEDWDFVIKTNLNGSFAVAKAAIPHLLKTKGAIVSVASLSALRADPGFAAYAASKAGMVMMTQCIARDYGMYGLRANAICPGWVRTEMANFAMSTAAAARGIDTDTLFQEVTAHVPARRAAQPHEAAGPIAFLLSEQSSYINGAVLTVDGGAAVVDVATLALDMS